jgi:osmoprotectant transport system permease protein
MSRQTGVWRGLGWGLLAAFLVRPTAFAPLLAPLTHDGAPAIYDQGDLLALAAAHLGMVLVATTGSTVIAVALALTVTRGHGRALLPMSRVLVGVGQTFPPVAVLAVAVPLVGFGAAPTLIALIAYGLLPIFENALTGLEGVPPSIREAADGMGLDPWQRLWRVDLPLARPLIVEGVRQALVISVGTATLGSTVASQGLGEVIIAGLLSDNTAFVLQGGAVTGLMAILLHDAVGVVTRPWMRGLV